MLLLSGVGILSLFAVFLLVAFTFRKIVPPNEVHIAQSAKKTRVYGKDKEFGNVYYKFPSFIPLIGVEVVSFPVSVFDLSFDEYKAYDKDKVPFVVDITAFFRISDPETASERVSSLGELENQLRSVVQGAVRTSLAKSDIEQIMLDRAVFGQQFTNEVSNELKSWGVSSVKSIELMDIRDTEGSKVIDNIQMKKKSNIEMESRREVAQNSKIAQMSEIEAQKEVDLESEKARELVNSRKVETDRKVALAKEQLEQEVKEQQKLTKEKEMNVREVETVRLAEISKTEKLVKEQQEREARLIKANADLDVETKDKEAIIVKSEGLLRAKENESKAIETEGIARANADKAQRLAPIEAEISLAKEIGSNAEYQKYLISIKGIEASKEVGMEQAKALTEADVKIISNTESPSTGIKDVMELFSSKGGINVGAMLDGLKSSDTVKKLLEKSSDSVKE